MSEERKFAILLTADNGVTPIIEYLSMVNR